MDLENGLNVIVVDYNNDGYRDVIGFYNDYSNFVAYPQDYYGYERKKLISRSNVDFEIDESIVKYWIVHGRKVFLEL